MVSIHAQDLTLTYQIHRKLTLAPPDARLKPLRQIQRTGQRHFVTALDKVSFSLSPGDRLGLVGMNGAGKTTLLKVLYGIYSPTSGKVIVDGRVDALFNVSLGFRPEATGRRNIVLRGLINGWSISEIERRMDEIIDFSDLGQFIDLPLKSYSQGMAARLAFSVATALEPEILLLDEWIGAGDAQFQEKAKHRLTELTKRAGIVVLASHNTKIIDTICNKTLELEAGRVKRLEVNTAGANERAKPQIKKAEEQTAAAQPPMTESKSKHAPT